MTATAKTPELKNAAEATAGHREAFEKLAQEKKILTAAIAAGTLLICYPSKSYYIRAAYDWSGRLRVKQYYRYWNEDRGQPFQKLTQQNF